MKMNMRTYVQRIMRYAIIMIVMLGVVGQTTIFGAGGSCFTGGHSCFKTSGIIYSILTKVCSMQTDVDEIEEKVCNIESILENLEINISNVDIIVDLEDLESKVCVIEDNTETLIDGQDEILSKVCVIDSKVDNIVVDIDSTTIDNIESKVCAIDSKLDDLEVDCNLQPIVSKLCVIESIVEQPQGCVTKVFNQSDIPFTITEPGFYILEENVTYSDPLTAIIVSADDVVLDLCNRRITVTSTMARGIDVAFNNSNVTIMNGTIDGGRDGISYYASSTPLNKLVIDSVNFCNVREKAIRTVDAGGVYVRVEDWQIRNCTFLNCGAFNTTGGIVDLVEVQETVLTGCFFSENSNASNTLINLEDSDNCSILNSQFARNAGATELNGILMNNASKCFLQHLRFDCNSGGIVTILNLMNTTKSTFLDITMNGNTATDVFVGVSASASYPSNENRFERVFINGNQSNSVAGSAGFLFDGSNNNSFTNCQVTNNTSQTQAFNGFVSCNADGNMYIDCVGSNNNGYGDGDGFLMADCTRHYYIRCLAFSNCDAGFQVAGASTDSGFRDCQAMYNGRVGFDLVGADTTITLFRNIACGNGSK